MKTRTTLSRQWTALEKVQASYILDAIIANGGEVVAVTNLMRLTGFSYAKVTDIMPLVVHQARETLPGSALLVLRRVDGYHYSITSDADAAKEAYWPVVRKMNTMARRMSDAVDPLRSSTDLAAVNLVDVADALVASMRENTLDAIYALDHTEAPAAS